MWLLASVACREPAGDGPEVTREEFIETYAALLRVEAQAADSADARQRRAWVLERRGLTAEDLERFAARHADEPEAMAEIWKEIEARIRALQTVDTAKSNEFTAESAESAENR